MSWTYLPLTSGVNDWSLYPVFKEIYLATAERAYATGQCVWPPPSFSFHDGTVTGATETTISTGDTFCGGTDDTSGLTYAVPWICNTTNPEVPSSWTLWIDDDDYTKIVKVSIASWTNTGVITFDNIRDFVTSGQIPSVASLVGKKFHIVGYQSLCPIDRIMERPNDYQWATGTILTLTAGTDTTLHPASPTTALIRDDGQKWVTNEHVGREVLYYADEGGSAGVRLQRVVITANTGNVLSFATQAHPPQVGSAYVVVTADGFAYPGRDPVYPLAHYRGYMDGYSTHHPLDIIGGADMPASIIKIPLTGPDGCEDTDTPIYMLDLYTGYPRSDDCLPTDHYYAPNLYKTISGLQNAIESLSFEFTFGPVGKSVPNINAAEMFSAAGINSFSGTTGSVEGVDAGGSNNAIAISVGSLPYYPIQVHYSIRMADGSIIGGRGVVTEAGRLLDESSGGPFIQSDPTTTPPTPGANGRPIIISLGWTRYVPREVKRMFFDQDYVFIPDIHVDPDTGTTSAIDPAAPDVPDSGDCYGVGRYVKRTKSTNYITRKQETQSWKFAQGAAWETGDAFTSGDLARYVGDNFFDPSITSSPGASGWSQFKNDVQDPYYDHFYVGRLSPEHETFVRNQIGGTATGGGGTYLVDASKNWYDHGWTGGVMRQETGTADDGSTTSLSDSTKTSGDAACYWGTTRFGGDNPFIGFTVEIDIPDGSDVTTFQRMITSSDPATATVSWDLPLPSSASGMAYRINECYINNRYKGRSVKIVKADGSVVTATIAGNSDKVLYLTADLGFDPTGCQYLIVEPTIGGVWKFDGTNWVKPSGADAQRMGVETAADFHTNQRDNLPTIVKRFGRYLIGDYVHSGVFNEMQAALQVLKKTKVGGSWAGSAVDGVDEYNALDSVDGVRGYLTNDPPDGSGPAVSSTETLFTDHLSVGGGAPFCGSNYYQSIAGGDESVQAYATGMNRECGYLQIDISCTRRSGTTTFYVYSENPPYVFTVGEATEPVVYVFDDNGDPVAFETWSVIGTAGVAPTHRIKLGSMDYPDGSFHSHQNTISGYTVTDQCGVVDRSA